MAYQNVGQCRFYVDYLLWRKSLGMNPSDYIVAVGNAPFADPEATLDKTISLNPTNQADFDFYGGSGGNYVELLAPPNIPDPTGATQSTRYFAVLGHNYASADSSIYVGTNSGTTNNVVNLDFEYDGFSIGTNYSDLTDDVYRIYYDSAAVAHTSKVACYSVGNYYDMPNAPNLSLTMSREYGGTKEFTTYNGSSMSNTMWSRAPLWGTEPAWELYQGAGPTPAPHQAKSGRRTWDLKFSYMDDGDLWGSNQSLSHSAWINEAMGQTYDDGDIVPATSANVGEFTYSLLTDDNFFSQVWHKTLSGTLPFIFQPDSSNSNPDQFAIAKFKDNSLKATQSAFNVYDISLSIEEAW